MKILENIKEYWSLLFLYGVKEIWADKSKMDSEKQNKKNERTRIGFLNRDNK